MLHGVRLPVIVGKYGLHEPSWHVWPFDDLEEWRTGNLLQMGDSLCCYPVLGVHLVSLRFGSFLKKSFFLQSFVGGFSPIIPLQGGTLSGSCTYSQGIVSFPYVSVKGKSPRCSPFYERSLSLGLSPVGPYSLQGSSSPIATLEPEPLANPSPYPCCLAELVVNFSLRHKRRTTSLL